MENMPDIEWRGYPTFKPGASGYYLAETSAIEWVGVLLWWDEKMREWFRSANSPQSIELKGDRILRWCPVLPVNRDGSVTFGKVHFREGAFRPPSESTYPRFSADYACHKCGGNDWDMSYHTDEEILNLSCNRCFFTEKVRPADWPGPALNPVPPPAPTPTIHLKELNPATDMFSMFRWKASAGPHWAEGYIPGEALLLLLRNKDAQQYLGISFSEYKT